MYKIVGTDQKEYGPVSAEQIIQWIKEGRANGQTVARFEEEPWKPLSTFPEFANFLVPSLPPLLSAAASTTLPTSPKNHPFAITGLILSLLGLLQCCTPLFALLGIGFSCVGLVQINRNPGMQRGKGLAFSGIIIGVAGLAFSAFLFFSGFFHHVFKHLTILP